MPGELGRDYDLKYPIFSAKKHRVAHGQGTLRTAARREGRAQAQKLVLDYF